MPFPRPPSDRADSARWWFLVPSVLWTAVIVYLLTRGPRFFSGPAAPVTAWVPRGALEDAFHTLVFLVLAVLLRRGIAGARPTLGADTVDALALAVAALASVGSELAQLAAPPRAPQLWDVALNLLGAAAGIGLARRPGRRRPPSPAT
ncbi:MAG TPA: VanZ family protein [Candidatus Binatia bacterium]|nr:VanZ family protein [Candidatus Binatia bacterium]